MSNEAAHTRRYQTGEVVIGIPILISLILGYFFPLTPPAAWPRAASVSAGMILLAIGLWMIVITRRHFSQAGQPTDPGLPTTRLITTGPFAWSRNPLYFGAMLIFIGLGGLFHSLWFLVFLLPTILAVQLILIVPEERYLAATFGEPYRQYSRVVRRWVGRRG